MDTTTPESKILSQVDLDVLSKSVTNIPNKDARDFLVDLLKSNGIAPEKPQEEIPGNLSLST